MQKSIQSKVATRANMLTPKFGRSLAFVYAWAAEKLIAEMQANESVEFVFTKEDGTQRAAKGTIVKEVVLEHWTPKGEAHKKPEVVRYFDVEINLWRSFRIDRLQRKTA